MLCVEIRLKNEAILCLLNVLIFLCQRQKFIVRLIYFRNSDFKGLSTVATQPDRQSNKTCRGHWDSFQHPKLMQYAGIENHVRKYIVKQCVTSFLPPPKRKDFFRGQVLEQCSISFAKSQVEDCLVRSWISSIHYQTLSHLS